MVNIAADIAVRSTIPCLEYLRKLMLGMAYPNLGIVIRELLQMKNGFNIYSQSGQNEKVIPMQYIFLGYFIFCLLYPRLPHLPGYAAAVLRLCQLTDEHLAGT